MNMTTAAAVGNRTASAAAMGGNAELVRRGYAAFNAADIDTLTRIMDKDVSWHTPGRTSIGGTRKGQQDVFAQFGRYGGETGGTFRATLLDVYESDDGGVVGLHRNTGERNGKRLDVLCCIVFEAKDGRIVSGREHFFDLYAWDAFWA
ncbi:MAG: nuclear transport factor 2 family protein [Bauldia sp.]|nr:nuclear transport factor 2 family protein [Bauldia sp.]